MAQREVIELIKKYISRLNQNGIYVSEAFLYGSYARNEQREESDIDVLLLSDKTDLRNDEATGMIWKIAFELDHRIAPYGVSRKKFFEDD